MSEDYLDYIIKSQRKMNKDSMGYLVEIPNQPFYVNLRSSPVTNSLDSPDNLEDIVDFEQLKNNADSRDLSVFEPLLDFLRNYEFPTPEEENILKVGEMLLVRNSVGFKCIHEGPFTYLLSDDNRYIRMVYEDFDQMAENDTLLGFLISEELGCYTKVSTQEASNGIVNFIRISFIYPL
jgi:hypothetical protein